MLLILNIENIEILTELPISRAEKSANHRRLLRHSCVPDTLCYRGRLFLAMTFKLFEVYIKLDNQFTFLNQSCNLISDRDRLKGIPPICSDRDCDMPLIMNGG